MLKGLHANLPNSTSKQLFLIRKVVFNVSQGDCRVDKEQKSFKTTSKFLFLFLESKGGIELREGVGEKRAIRLRNKNFRAPIALKERMREERERENVKIRFIGGNKKQFSVPD